MAFGRERSSDVGHTDSDWVGSAPTLDQYSAPIIYCLKSEGGPRYARLPPSSDCCRRTTVEDARFVALGLSSPDPFRVLALQVDLPSCAALCGQGRSRLGVSPVRLEHGV